MKSNKFNFILLIALILSISLGCNFFTKNSTKSSETNGEGGKANSKSEDSNTDDIQIKVDENSESVNEDSTDSADSSDDDDDENITTAVKFAKGKASRSYSDAVVRATSNTYILGASAGQNMSVSISSTEDNAEFRVIAPNGKRIAGTQEDGVTNFNETLPASGNYKIVVTPSRGNATYKINFAISAKEQQSETRETSGGLTTTVKFRKGGSGASYENAVIRGERNTYILGAGGGQFMNVSISSVEANADFSIIAPNGQTLAAETTNWNGQLPMNGKYRIVVASIRGNATYRINFAVK
ncbi:MAG: hypothetical protein ACR2J3_03035 [Aridibacter sp.]